VNEPRGRGAVNERERVAMGYSHPWPGPLTWWGENLGAPQGLLSPKVEPAPDLSRSVEMASPSIFANPTLEFNHILGEAIRTARLKSGAEKSGTKPDPRRAEILAPPGSGVRSPAPLSPFPPPAVSLDRPTFPLVHGVRARSRSFLGAMASTSRPPSKTACAIP
jgi:hypothetical protein